jgi:hypothetical protein
VDLSVDLSVDFSVDALSTDRSLEAVEAAERSSLEAASFAWLCTFAPDSPAADSTTWDDGRRSRAEAPAPATAPTPSS